MTPRPTTETTQTRLVKIVPQFDCTGHAVWIREELVQEGDETIVVSRTVFRWPSVKARQQ
jgi:hypothetical protein